MKWNFMWKAFHQEVRNFHEDRFCPLLCHQSLEHDLVRRWLTPSPSRRQHGEGMGGGTSQPTQNPFRSWLPLSAGPFFASSRTANGAPLGPTLLSKTWPFQNAFHPCCRRLTSAFRASPQAASCPPTGSLPPPDSSILDPNTDVKKDAHPITSHPSARPYDAEDRRRDVPGQPQATIRATWLWQVEAQLRQQPLLSSQDRNPGSLPGYGVLRKVW